MVRYLCVVCYGKGAGAMRRFLWLVVLLVVLFSVHVVEAKSYSVENLRINAALQRDGSAEVNETLTMTFDGDFSRFTRDFQLADEHWIEDVVVSEGGKPYKRLEAFSADRPAGCYAVEEKDGKLVIEFYYKVNKGSRTFEISYVMRNAVEVHNDVAELNRKFVDVGWDRIKKLDVLVTLPGDAKGELRVWSHGPEWGKTEITGADSVLYQISGLPADTFAEVRVTSPKELFPDAERRSGKDALEGIIKQETEWAEESNRRREESRKRMEELKKEQEQEEFIWSIITTVLLVANMALAAIPYWKKRQLKPREVYKYYRDLPSDITPAELGVLVTAANGFEWCRDSTLYNATILDLSLKGFIRVRSTAPLGSKVSPEYIMIGLPDGKDTGLLAVHEQKMMSFVMQALGGRSEGTMRDLIDYTGGNAGEAGDTLRSCKKEAKALMGAKGYLVPADSKNVFYLMFIFLTSMLVFVLATLSYNDSIMLAAGLSIILNVYLCVKGITKDRLLQKGVDEAELWRGFKNFLNDFTLFDEKELPELAIWQKFLVYAIVLKEADKLLKQLPKVYPQLNDAGYMSSHDELALLGAMRDDSSIGNGLFDAFESMSSEIESKISRSSSSSGSGGGGGSSGGNSGGSSGGGGRAD